MNELQTTEQKKEIADGIAASTLVQFFRENPGAITPELQKAIAQFAVLQDSANKAIKEADAAELIKHYAAWKELFLTSRKSEQTRRAYARAIKIFETFCGLEGIEPTALKYADAVKFTQSAALIQKEGNAGPRAPESIRRDIAAVSAFYTELYKLSESKIINPFIRIGKKPQRQKTHIKDVPTAKELKAILANTDGIIKAAIFAMSKRGFRIGALKGLHLQTRNGKTTFETITKGKAQNGTIAADIVETITAAGLPKIEPFAGISTATLTMRIERALDRLAERGIIPGYETTLIINGKPQARTCSKFSCHSFRHFYATAEYKKNGDIERLRKLLNHADIGTTQIYLQSLGLIDE